MSNDGDNSPWKRDQPDHDRFGIALQACHDALISNPDLREAYNALVKEGMDSAEAHIEARREVFGEDYEFTGSGATLLKQVGGAGECANNDHISGNSDRPGES